MKMTKSIFILSVLLSQGYVWSADRSLETDISSLVVFANGSLTHNFDVSVFDGDGNTVTKIVADKFHTSLMPLSEIEKVSQITADPQVKTIQWLASCFGVAQQACDLNSLEAMQPHLHKLFIMAQSAQHKQLEVFKRDLREREKKALMMKKVKEACSEKRVPLADVYHRVQFNNCVTDSLLLQGREEITEQKIIGQAETNVFAVNSSLAPKKLTINLAEGSAKEVTVMPMQREKLCERSQYQGIVTIATKTFLDENIVSNWMKDNVYAQPEEYKLDDSEVAGDKNWVLEIGVTNVTGRSESLSEEDRDVALYNAITNSGEKKGMLNQVYLDIVKD